jgi:hypothetical protein
MITLRAVLCAALLLGVALHGQTVRPKAGPVEIMRSSEIRAGMQGVAWTVFQGIEPEPIPVEIIGAWKNAWGPRQDVILAKLGGKAARTNVAGGMSGSPVYVDGKLIGAIALRISVFSPDAICGITPIEHMLEINEIDNSRPSNAKVPAQAFSPQGLDLPANLLAAASPRMADFGAKLVPIETPLSFAGFNESTLREFKPFFDQLGISAVQGGAAGGARGARPVDGWQNALQPGDAIAGVLVSGDLNVTGLGTVTYNDGRRVLAFGHAFFNLGPLSMPMSRGEVLTVLSSQFQPNKFANAGDIVGALRQDRHSGILGVLGESAETIPVSLTVKSAPVPGGAAAEKKYSFDVFVHPRWTPFLMLLTTFNSLQNVNDGTADEATYSLKGRVEFDGIQALNSQTLVTAGDAPMPPPMQLATWWAEKFNRLMANPISMPKIRSVETVVEVHPQKLMATIDGVTLASTVVDPGAEVQGRVWLRPWRGERYPLEFRFKLPKDIARGEHRLLVSDSDTLNRAQSMAGSLNRSLSPAEIVSLANQERSKNQVHVSLVEARPTAYVDDKALPALPPSVLNVLQNSRPAMQVSTTPDTARVQQTLSIDHIAGGSATVRLRVR